jgi:hypothetical protein
MSRGSPYILDRRLATEPGDSAAYPYDRVEENRIFEERAVAANMSVQGVKLNDWASRIVSLEGGGGSGPAGDAVFFNTLTDLAANSIAADVDVVAVGGYAAAGDAGQTLLLKRVAAEPTHEGKKQSADGAWWEYVMPATGIRIEWFGGAADYTGTTGTDNLAAYVDAEVFLMSNYNSGSFPELMGGPCILFGYGGNNGLSSNLGAGGYYFSGTIIPTRTVHLKGASAAGVRNNSGWATKLVFPASTRGVALRGHTTGPTVNGAAGSTFEDLCFFSKGHVGETTNHGFDTNTHFIMRNCRFGGFGGDGVHIEADIGSGAGSNANLWYMEHVHTLGSSRHGVFVEGGDTNAGVGIAINAKDCAGYGIYDNSFLGNTWLACHTDSNTLGSYYLDGVNARSVLVGCYSESGQPTGYLGPTAHSIGGIHAAGLTAAAGSIRILDGGISAHRVVPGTLDNVGLDLRTATDSFMIFTTPGTFTFSLLYDGTLGAHGLKYAGLADNWAYLITNTSTSMTCGRSAGVAANLPVFPRGLFIGRQSGQNPSTAGRYLSVEASQPSSGSNAQGDIALFRGGTVSGGKLDLGWYRLTTGSAHVAGTDWQQIYCITGGPLTLAGGTVTTSTPVLNLTQTWNDAGVTFTGLKANFTSTASAANSIMLDLQMGGVSKWNVDKDGDVTQAGALTIAGAVTGVTTLNATGLATLGAGFAVDTGTKTATAVAGAATLDKLSGKITTEALTTAQDASYTLTLTNSAIAAADTVFVSVANGTNTQGTTVVTKVTPASGSAVIIVTNKHDSAQALNGTLVISFLVVKA